MYMGKKNLCIQYDNAEKICCWSGCHRKIIKLLSNQVILIKFMRKETNGSESDINNSKDVHAERVTDPEPEINESR